MNLNVPGVLADIVATDRELQRLASGPVVDSKRFRQLRTARQEQSKVASVRWGGRLNGKDADPRGGSAGAMAA